MRPAKAIHIFIVIFGINCVSFAVSEIFYPDLFVVQMLAMFDNPLYNFLLNLLFLLLLTMLLTKIICMACDRLKWKIQPKLKIGEVLINEDLVTNEQLNEAMTEQNLKTGEILIQTGRLKQDQLEDALKKQKNPSTMIGNILIEMGYVSEKDVQWALKQKAQRTLNLMMGEMLVQAEKLKQKQLDAGLKFQRMSRKMIGHILREMGYVSEIDIQWALKQKARKLGEILIDKGLLTPFDLAYALAVQTGEEIG